MKIKYVCLCPRLFQTLFTDPYLYLYLVDIRRCFVDAPPIKRRQRAYIMSMVKKFKYIKSSLYTQLKSWCFVKLITVKFLTSTTLAPLLFLLVYSTSRFLYSDILITVLCNTVQPYVNQFSPAHLHIPP